MGVSGRAGGENCRAVENREIINERLLRSLFEMKKNKDVDMGVQLSFIFTFFMRKGISKVSKL